MTLTAPAEASHVVALTVLPGAEQPVRDLCAALPALLRAVESRESAPGITCLVGFSFDAWRRIFERSAPAGLKPFEPVHGVTQTAPATPGDVLLHVRAARRDLCFELVTQVTAALRGAVQVELEVQGFRYFDNRNLLGFVELPDDATDRWDDGAVLLGEEEGEHAGGCFALVQTYLHDLEVWSELHVCEQERIMGRDKVSNLPLRREDCESGAPPGGPVPARGQALPVLRCSMAFGSPALDEFGTLLVAYCASPAVLETALRDAFVGVPAGSYHGALDFSTAVSGGLFYVPSPALVTEVCARRAGGGAPVGSARLRSVSHPARARR